MRSDHLPSRELARQLTAPTPQHQDTLMRLLWAFGACLALLLVWALAAANDEARDARHRLQMAQRSGCAIDAPIDPATDHLTQEPRP